MRFRDLPVGDAIVRTVQRHLMTGIALGLCMTWSLPHSGRSQPAVRAAQAPESETIVGGADTTTAIIIDYMQMRADAHEIVFGSEFDPDADGVYALTTPLVDGHAIVESTSGDWCNLVVHAASEFDAVRAVLESEELSQEARQHAIELAPTASLVLATMLGRGGSTTFLGLIVTGEQDGRSIGGGVIPLDMAPEDIQPLPGDWPKGPYVSDVTVDVPAATGNPAYDEGAFLEFRCACTEVTCDGQALTAAQCSYYQTWCRRANALNRLCLEEASEFMDVASCGVSAGVMTWAVLACVFGGPLSLGLSCGAAVGIGIGTSVVVGSLCADSLWDLLRGCQNDLVSRRYALASYACDSPNPDEAPFPYDPTNP